MLSEAKHLLLDRRYRQRRRSFAALRMTCWSTMSAPSAGSSKATTELPGEISGASTLRPAAVRERAHVFSDTNADGRNVGYVRGRLKHCGSDERALLFF